MIYSVPYSNKKNRHLPLLISMFGSHHLQKAIYRPRGLPFYQWFFCCKGTGELTIQGETSILHKGQGFLILANEPHSYKELSEDFTIHMVAFTGPCVLEILRVCGMYETGVYQVSKESVFTNYVQSILELRTRKGAGTQIEYSQLCYGFLIELSCCIQKINTSRISQENEAVRCITEFLEEHYQSSISLDDLAKEVNLTKSYMCTMFKKEMHFSIIQYLLIIRIGWARLYLEQYPERNVYEIGKMCGFESPSYFGKTFKKIVGVTPENYKYVKSIRV